MFGWELPPYNSGGLGTASLGITQGLAERGIDIDFVLPGAHGPYPYRHMRIHTAGDTAAAPSFSAPYGGMVAADGQISHKRPNVDSITPYLHASWYASAIKPIIQQSDFEVVHAHDWMTYYSGLRARAAAHARGQDAPLIAHIHATEYDRGGDRGGNRAIADIERTGLQAADRVIAVSQYTARMVHRHYDVPMSRISVVHNGINSAEPQRFDLAELKKHYKIVLFMGRITMSKGPEYFLKLAKSVTDRDPKVKFVMVGSGDMEHQMIEQAARMGLTGKILFSSFLRGQDVERAYQLADLFVMPSVSEPFGLVALEALQNGTPAIVSKQSGVVEVSKHLVQVDFWDTDKMRDAVMRLLAEPHTANQIVRLGQQDMRGLTWADAARKIEDIYRELLPQPAFAFANV